MKRQSRKLLIFGIVFLLIVGACAAPAPPTPTPVPPTPTPGPLDVVKTFQDAYNKRDTEGFLALFGDNPTWDIGFTATGKQAVRNIVEFWFKLNSQIDFSDCKLENNSVSCKYTYKDDCNPPEAAVYHIDAKFQFVDGKISAFSGQYTNSLEMAAFDTYQSQVMSWASQNLPEDFAKITDAEFAKFSGTGDQGGGKLSATELGQVVDGLYKAYAKATPVPPTPTSGQLDLVKAFQDTFNKRDTEGFLALFADKLNWDSFGDWPISALSLKAVRNVAEFFFEVNEQIELSNCQLENDLVSCKMTMKDDCMPPEPFVFHADMKFRITNDKISYVVSQPDSNDAVASETYLIQVATWAKQNLPEDYAAHNNAAEYTKFNSTGDQGSGILSASEYGQVYHRMCTGYAKAKK